MTYSKNDQEEEIDIGNVMELEPQVFGYETQRGILRRSDFVPGKLHSRMIVFIFGLWRERHIEVDLARFLAVAI